MGEALDTCSVYESITLDGVYVLSNTGMGISFIAGAVLVEKAVLGMSQSAIDRVTTTIQ
jgi:hypothetical protein